MILLDGRSGAATYLAGPTKKRRYLIDYDEGGKGT